MSRPAGFTVEFYQIFKEEFTALSHNGLQKIKWGRNTSKSIFGSLYYPDIKAIQRLPKKTAKQSKNGTDRSMAS